MNTRAALKEAPLCVDLDGTVTRTDLLFEALARLLKTSPWMILVAPFWLLAGKASLKRRLADRVSIDPSSLPYNEEFLAWLGQEKARGREIVLVTAADEHLAKRVADHLGLFSYVLGSDGKRNLKGSAKFAALHERFRGEFEYAGDSRADLEVWRGCQGAITVNAAPSLVRRVEGLAPVVRRFDRSGPWWKPYLKAVRIHQWAKNVLVYVPLLTSHQFLNPILLLKATCGGILFGLCSSAQYILNDLADLEADRCHPSKRRRAFASGELSIRTGMLLVPALLAAGIGGGLLLGPAFAAMLGIYFLVSLAYSLYWKRVVLLDVFVLSGLYTLRLFGGHAVTGIRFSEWLSAFAVFLFLSLGFVKRAAELRNAAASGAKLAGRGYQRSDVDQVNLFGVCSAFLSAVIFILYLQSDHVRELYRNPEILWLLSPIFLYWVSRIWLLSARGQINEDPVLFVLRDRTTYVVGLMAALIMLAATMSPDALGVIPR